MKSKGLLLAFIMSSSCLALAAPPVEVLESAVLTFSNGSHQLPEEEKMKLKRTIEEARARGKIAKVEVAVWSDKDHPATGSLAKADEKLASERIEEVKKQVKDSLGRFESVEAYNMANNASWLGRYFHTDDAKLDAIFAKRTAGTLAREDFSLIKREGAPSKAVVILKIKE